MLDGTAPDIVRRSDALHVRAIRSDIRECDFVASTETIDSYDEIIDVASWKLDRFKSNPVVLYGHQSYELPIGQATRCEVVGSELQCTIRFATAEANPEAEKVWRLVQEKVLRAVSVGFRPTDGKYEMRDGRDVYVLYGADLREISVVAVPANGDCLAKMKSDSLEKADPAMRDRIRAAAQASNVSENSQPELPAPFPPSTEPRMDPKELQLKLDAADKALIDAKVSEKAASDKASAFDLRVRALETERDALTAANATLTKEHTKAAADRDLAVARAEKAEAGLIEVEVESLVGKKIAPTEKEDFIALRKSSPELFTSMVAKRADMKLTETIIKSDQTVPVINGTTDNGVAIWNKL